jgi:hypothetical protein
LLGCRWVVEGRKESVVAIKVALRREVLYYYYYYYYYYLQLIYFYLLFASIGV